jgi:hypothetical protein
VRRLAVLTSADGVRVADCLGGKGVGVPDLREVAADIFTLLPAGVDHEWREHQTFLLPRTGSIHNMVFARFHKEVERFPRVQRLALKHFARDILEQHGVAVGYGPTPFFLALGWCRAPDVEGVADNRGLSFRVGGDRLVRRAFGGGGRRRYGWYDGSRKGRACGCG